MNAKTCAASLLICLFVCSAPTFSKAPSAEQIQNAYSEQTSELDSVNNFIRSTNRVPHKARKTIIVESGTISARLLTPINSKIAGTGDSVEAVVTESTDASGKKWLPPGAILHGKIEASRKANYGKTDAFVTVRFYSAEVNGEQVELTAASKTPDGKLLPSHYHKYTKKEMLKGVLMTATRIAVPAAIGTGGLSIAITTGAGAAIGFALAEKDQHIKGAIDGAWQGSGLSVLNPIVKKGKTLQLAEGAPLSLSLAEPTIVPKFSKEDFDTCIKVSGDLLSSDDGSPKQITQLNTQAKILNQSKSTSDTIIDERADKFLSEVDRAISQNNLAVALAVLDRAQRLYPTESRVRKKRSDVLRLITEPTAQTASSSLPPN